MKRLRFQLRAGCYFGFMNCKIFFKCRSQKIILRFLQSACTTAAYMRRHLLSQSRECWLGTLLVVSRGPVNLASATIVCAV